MSKRSPLAPPRRDLRGQSALLNGHLNQNTGSTLLHDFLIDSLTAARKSKQIRHAFGLKCDGERGGGSSSKMEGVRHAAWFSFHQPIGKRGRTFLSPGSNAFVSGEKGL